MGTNHRKVKPAIRKRYRITLDRTVTFRLSSVIEVEVDELVARTLAAPHRLVILNTIREQLAAEARQGVDRDWKTEKCSNNRDFSVQWSSIEEVHDHITEAGDHPIALQANRHRP